MPSVIRPSQRPTFPRQFEQNLITLTKKSGIHELSALFCGFAGDALRNGVVKLKLTYRF